MHSSFKLAADCVERSATSLLLSRTPSALYDQAAILTHRCTLHGLDHPITMTIVLRDNELLRATQISTNRPPFVRWGIWRFSPKPFWIWKHIHVHKVHVYEVYAHEVHAYELHAHKVHAHEVHACEVHAYEVHAHAYEVHAHEVASASLYSPCLSQHQANVVDASERVRVLGAQYLLISSERLRVHRFGLFILALSLQHRATAVVTKSESRRKGIVDNGISASRLSPNLA